MDKNIANEMANKITSFLIACDFLEMSKKNIIQDLILEFFAENPNFNDSNFVEMLEWCKTANKLVNWLEIENNLQRVVKPKLTQISSDKALTTEQKKKQKISKYF
jgi:hypothetical protein